VVSAGISGAAAAFMLAEHSGVVLVEAEGAPGDHSTGRSAALYTRNYGPPLVQRINAAGHEYNAAPPVGFSDATPLWPELVAAAAYERGVMDMDVASMHQGFLRGFRRRGGTLLCDARASRFERHAGRWRVAAGTAKRLSHGPAKPPRTTSPSRVMGCG